MKITKYALKGYIIMSLLRLRYSYKEVKDILEEVFENIESKDIHFAEKYYLESGIRTIN